MAFKQLKKFIVIGALSTLINYGIFFLLYRAAHLNYSIAAAIGFISGLLFGYIYNRSWTFEAVSEKKSWEIILYASVYIFSLILNVALLNILVSAGHINPLLANLFALAVVFCSNFFGLKYLVFHKPTRARLQNLLPLFSKAFIIILMIKLAAGAMFGSRYITEGFIPFVNFFSATLQNPYAHFINSAAPAFPYPGGMLWMLGLPYGFFHWALPVSLANNLHIQLFLLRLPVLFFDVLIYILLCKLLPTKEKKVLWLYFASPLVFYVNYFYGQLDIIPTALLLLSLFLLVKRKNTWSVLALGLSIAAKTHIAIALPFYLLYLYRNRQGWREMFKVIIIPAAVFLILNPFLASPAFLTTVFNNPEQKRLFFLSISFNFEHLGLFIAPAALLLIFYKFASYKKLNIDSLILVLGLIYTVLVALVAPTEGWYLWPFPFLVFFFIKYKNAPVLSLWAVNGFFLLYFLFSRDNNFLQSLSPTFVGAAAAVSPYHRLGGAGELFQNLLFTALETSLAAAALWNYNIGSRTTELYQQKKEHFLVGIAGDSGVGKSTLADMLEKAVGTDNLARLSGDDVHKWERGDSHWQEMSHLNPKANFIHTDYDHAVKLLAGEAIERVSYDHATGKFIGPIKIEPNKFIIFQGLMPFLLEQVRDLHDLKIYLEAEDAVRLHWKTLRDQGQRGYSREAVAQQVGSRKVDAETFVHPQKNFADWIIQYFKNGEELGMQYLLKNSIEVDTLLAELSKTPGLKINHNYNNLQYQQINFSGQISGDEIQAIAYKLYPNIYDLVENQPAFQTGLHGLNQLFFVHHLAHFYKIKTGNEKIS